MLRRRRQESDDLAGVSLTGVMGRPQAKTKDSSSAGMQPDTKPSRAHREPRYAIPDPVLTGTVNLNPRGFAFVSTPDNQAFYCRAEKARRLLSGDVVQFRANPPDAEGKREVRDISSIKRREQVLLCAVTEIADLTYLVPDEPCFTPVQLSTQPAEGTFGTGDVIAVRLPAYDGRLMAVTEPGAPLFGEFVANLGPRTRDGFDLDYVRMKHGFEQDLPLELQGLAASFEDPSHYAADLTPFVTIDGESTRDFDDAVHAEPRTDGGWDVAIAVADVSHYVAPGTSLDEWASRRGTSVYLPGLTLPMLPEWLSTDLCSLKPGVTRRAVVLRARLDARGAVLSRHLERALIQSAARLTYTEVAAFLETTPTEEEALSPVSRNLRALHDVYKVLAERRKEQGRLDFEDPEPTAKFRDGRIVVEWEVRNDAHKLVEELMLLTNQETASMVVDRYGMGIFRHQPAPSAENWASLTQWAAGHGQSLPAEPSLKAMSDLVGAVPDEVKAEGITLVRQCMQKAKYVKQSSDELAQRGGHFSLSAPCYTHFTSPIRRYLDLMVHRLLLAPEGHVLSADEEAHLGGLVEMSSDRSMGSRGAERLMWDRLKLNGFLGEHTKEQTLSARVVKLTPRGFRVLLSGWQVPAWLPGIELKRSGIVKGEGDVWSREVDGSPVRVGAQLHVSWTGLNLERPAYPELQVKVAA